MRTGLAAVTMCVIALAGCGGTKTVRNGPNGLPVTTISAWYASSVYNRAAQVCPVGYKEIVPMQYVEMKWRVVIECNYGNATPVPAKVPTQEQLDQEKKKS